MLSIIDKGVLWGLLCVAVAVQGAPVAFREDITLSSNEIVQAAHVHDGEDMVPLIINDEGVMVAVSETSPFSGVSGFSYVWHPLRLQELGLPDDLAPPLWVPRMGAVGEGAFFLRDFSEDSLRVAALPRGAWDEVQSISLPAESRRGFFGVAPVADADGVWIPLNYGGVVRAIWEESGDFQWDLQMIPGDTVHTLRDDSLLQPEPDSVADTARVRSIYPVEDSLWVFTATPVSWVFTDSAWSDTTLFADASLLGMERSPAGRTTYYGSIGTTPVLYVEGVSGEFEQYDVPNLGALTYGDDSTLIVFTTESQGRFYSIENTDPKQEVSSWQRSYNAVFDTAFVLQDPRVYGVDLVAYADSFYLSIATSDGALFGAFDQLERAPEFTLFRTDRPVRSDLREVYAQPSILNNRFDRVLFVYSLEEASTVTIDIFDANMDFVCRIVDEEQRSPGGTQHSTDRRYDSWDGTRNNSGGERVSPGVYIFRIRTGGGEQAFGKVVVAKN
ncbi:hypothetical protein [Chitinivibrio alkaliphilus]|uniref:Uncharacterized protein n=1 Tax=Chitinivibrio alkaliphilus ACht1 TaxID=1313304 RepID=U7DD48_9BACT|nr:hypothetical protein [Chitinivibrio alkaliphilus]ERP38801.1 hypothetical protein CALK_0571 [Chitinivibrio alkaliphilus ACht1]